MKDFGPKITEILKRTVYTVVDKDDKMVGTPQSKKELAEKIKTINEKYHSEKAPYKIKEEIKGSLLIID